MEYSVANAPVLIVTSNNEFLYIDTPLAAYRADEFNEIKRCNASLSYMGYHLFLDRGDYSCRSFFDGIKNLMTINRIKENGVLVCNLGQFIERNILNQKCLREQRFRED